MSSPDSTEEPGLLPLFPLGVVLFPGSLLPLHIFEERYKILINECLQEKNVFGINLVVDGTLAKIGCTARVTSLVKRYDDGQMDIVVQGVQRFSLRTIDETKKPYWIARIEYIINESEVPDKNLVNETVRLYRDFVSVVYKAGAPADEVNPDHPELAFLLAQKAGMTLLQRQAVLDSPSENARLHLVRNHLVKITPKLEQAEQITRIIQNDGYL